jgi:hypothetical protein
VGRHAIQQTSGCLDRWKDVEYDCSVRGSFEFHSRSSLRHYICIEARAAHYLTWNNNQKLDVRKNWHWKAVWILHISKPFWIMIKILVLVTQIGRHIEAELAMSEVIEVIQFWFLFQTIFRRTCSYPFSLLIVSLFVEHIHTLIDIFEHLHGSLFDMLACKPYTWNSMTLFPEKDMIYSACSAMSVTIPIRN